MAEGTEVTKHEVEWFWLAHYILPWRLYVLEEEIRDHKLDSESLYKELAKKANDERKKIREEKNP
jgi:hypothetical protein